MTDKTRWDETDWNSFQSPEYTFQFEPPNKQRSATTAHLLPQGKAFQDNILAHQSSGIWECHSEVSGVFPDGT